MATEAQLRAMLAQTPLTVGDLRDALEGVLDTLPVRLAMIDQSDDRVVLLGPLAHASQAEAPAYGRFFVLATRSQ